MKMHLNRKMILGLTLAAVLLIGATGAATWAYFSDTSDPLTNELVMGNVTTQIVETFEAKDTTYLVYTKNPQISNIGEDDCYVRVRVLVTPENALSVSYEGDESFAEALTNVPGIDSFNRKGGWVYNTEDGMFYYTKVLKAATIDANGKKVPGDITTELFDTVKVTDTSIGGFEVQVYQEAVQASMYAKDGSVTEDYEKIWEAYEANKIPNSFKNSSEE